MKNIPHWEFLVQPFHTVFSQPSQVLFQNLLEGWILCPCRRFVTTILQFGDPGFVHSHDAYHRWFRAGAWTLASFLHCLAMLVVGLLGHPNVIWLLGDDTVHKKVGRKVEGAKSCRDAVRSTKNRVVYCWGLQMVLLCLEVVPPWGGEPLALPINVRLYRKRPSKREGKTLLDLMQDMLLEVKDWFPDRTIYFVGDGFYASLAGRLPPGIYIVSRIRHDAALYKMPPKRPSHRRGRKPTKGERLPTPAEIAAQAKTWKGAGVVQRGKENKRLVIIRHVVWHSVCPGRYIKLVISRDPEGIEEDDYFFTTDLSLDPGLLISRYGDRWGIEDTFRNAKQFLGIEQPQSWRGPGPERIAVMGYAVYSLIWIWFIKNGVYNLFPNRPWYASKSRPSFQDALAGIRHHFWVFRISRTVPNTPEFHKFSEVMIESLSRAA